MNNEIGWGHMTPGCSDPKSNLKFGGVAKRTMGQLVKYALILFAWCTMCHTRKSVRFTEDQLDKYCCATAVAENG